MMNPTTGRKRPLALIILSGFGWSPEEKTNAIAQAHTPFLDKYFSKYKHTNLAAAGEAVGLPADQPGNSEVSHLIIGCGQTVPLDINRIDKAIESGVFFENPQLIAAIDAARGSALHLIGLLSDGGIHSMNAHLYALLRMAASRGVERVYIHGFTDGRDTAPTSGLGYVRELIAQMREIGVGRVASLCGRYFAMDRDNRWDRIERAYRAIAEGVGITTPDPIKAVRDSYENGITDEFLEPIVVTEENGQVVGSVRPGDAVIFFNFRADRARQLTRAFTGLNFDRFGRERIQDLHFATFTQYDRALTSPIVFPPIALQSTLAQVFARHGISNIRISETEKYAHVTYFFNAGVEKEYPGESRILIPSPQVATYDQRPEMAAYKITDKICRTLDEGEIDVYIINFANGDLVGHTGNLKAAIAAVEAVDTCLGWVIGTIERVKGIGLITADHGNCELMMDPVSGAPHTAHTSNPVPFLLCDQEFKGTLREGGSLEDVAPTLLDLLAVPCPDEMTGKSLLCHSQGRNPGDIHRRDLHRTDANRIDIN
jgi:2,3-bisphosphoglycerate-independent phosphoglycerate mutase